jgi:mannosyltransferase OCH1-like enzyme
MFSSRRLHTGWRVLVVGGLLALVAAGNVDLDAASIQSDIEAAIALTSHPGGSGKVLNEHERNGLIATLVRASPDYRTSSISADILRNQLQGMNNAELLRKHSEMPGEVDNELDRVSAPGTPGGHQAVVEEAERVVADAEKMLRDMKRLSNVDEQRLATAELSVSPDYVDYLRSLAPIPKLVHVIWPDKDVVHSNLEMVKQGIYRIVELNPSWTLLVHDDDDVDRTIRNSTLLSVEDKRILEHAHPVERADVFRLHIMYTHGGLYTDIDRVMNVRYHTVLPHGARLVLPTNYDSNFMQDNFGSSRGNRLFKCMLDQQSMLRSKMERRRGWLSTGSIMGLGPDLFNRQISLALFGKEDASRNTKWSTYGALWIAPARSS